jgi:hypothetical protein
MVANRDDALLCSLHTSEGESHETLPNAASLYLSCPQSTREIDEHSVNSAEVICRICREVRR